MPWQGYTFPVADSREGLRAVVSDPFGVGKRGRTPPDGHMGVDIMGFRNRARRQRAHPDITPNFTSPEGTRILACGPGTVVRAGRISNGGRVAIEHASIAELADDGAPVGTMESLYLHLERIDVRPGQVVAGGQTIGTMGFNRNAANAVRHLHFEIQLRRLFIANSRGSRGEVDPAFYLQQWQRRSFNGAPRPVVIGLDSGAPGDDGTAGAIGGTLLG